MNLNDSTAQFLISELTNIASILISSIIAIIGIVLSRNPATRKRKLSTIKTRVERAWLRYLSLFLISLLFTPSLAFIALESWYFNRFYALLLFVLAALFFLLIPLSILSLILGEPTDQEPQTTRTQQPPKP